MWIEKTPWTNINKTSISFKSNYMLIIVNIIEWHICLFNTHKNVQFNNEWDIYMSSKNYEKNDGGINLDLLTSCTNSHVSYCRKPPRRGPFKTHLPYIKVLYAFFFCLGLGMRVDIIEAFDVARPYFLKHSWVASISLSSTKLVVTASLMCRLHCSLTWNL